VVQVGLGSYKLDLTYTRGPCDPNPTYTQLWVYYTHLPVYAGDLKNAEDILIDEKAQLRDVPTGMALST
jgi:hypothetical protein